MTTMLRKSAGVVLALLIGLTAGHGVSGQQKTAVTVFKSPTCGCCSKWIEHLEKSGFVATTNNMSDVSGVKTEYNIPAAAQSCHTAVVGGYVIEGHVPVADIRRLLKEKPAVVGIAAPGMPMGSPGMEGPNAEPYDVVTFDKQGRQKVFAKHGAAATK